jgi:RNA polymerase sigma-70 factor (ECF subfamily)
MLNITDIYNKYKEKTYSYVFSKIKDEITCEELTDDIFIKIFKHLDKYSEEKSKGNFEVWLFEITNNTIIDHYRRKRVIIEEFEDNNTQQYINSDNSYCFTNKIEYDEINIKIINEIKNLPKSKIKIAKLYFIEELSYDEISEALGIPIGTVKGTLNRARDDLKYILRKIYKINNNILR